MSYSPNLTIYLTNTLYHAVARPDVCIRNLTADTFSGTIKFRSMETSSSGDIQTVSVPPGTRCYTLPDISPLPPGESILWAEGYLGATPTITNTVTVFYSREYTPNYPVDPGVYRIYGFKNFNYWGGVYRLSYLPRARDLDFLYVENMAGEFDILTREEMESNVVPILSKNAKILTLEYKFNSIEHLDRFLQSFTRYLLDRYIILDNLDIETRIKIMVPILNYVMKPLNVMSIDLPDDFTTTYRIMFKFIFSGGAPLLVLAGAVVFGLGLLTGVVLTRVLSKQSGAVEIIYNTRDTSNNILRAQTAQLNTLIDSLDPTLFRVSKETVKAEINRIAEQAIQENYKISDLHATNLVGREVAIGVLDKIKYGAIGAGVGILAYILLRGGIK